MNEEVNKYHKYLNDNEIVGEELSADLKQFLDDAKTLKSPDFTKSKSDLWNAIESQIGQEESDLVKTVNWTKYMGIAAAILVLLVSGIVFFQNQYEVDEQVSYATDNQEQKELDLPDGSRVFLNAESELTYGDDWQRIVQLKGEAFFEVTKGEKFNIITDMGEVQVLGTSFNVSVRDGVFSVNCKTGRVQVSFNNEAKKPIILTKGEGMILDNGKVNQSVINPQIIGKWQFGEYHYDNRPLIEVLAELERQYGVDIKLEDKNQAMRPYHGYFIKEDLNVALSMVCDPMGLEFDIKNRVVNIRK